MKKFLLPAVAVIFGASSLNAQIFSESFDTEIPTTWTIIDVDGLASTSAQAEWASWAWNEGAGDASSSSWYDNNFTGPTNDWLITPGIAIPATGAFQVEFDASSHEANYLEEYELLYSTTGNTVADFTEAALLSVVDEAEAGTNRKVVLPVAANGQTVYIAIHHTSDDESMLHIDNFLVKELLADDIQMVSLSMNSTIVAGNINVTGTVKNNGANTISSFELSYDAGAGAVSETVTQTINSGATYNFSHSVPLAVATGPIVNLDVCATMAADLDNNNDCLSTTVSAVSSIVQKVTVGEERTGEWCGWCPRGTVALAEMGISNPNDFIGIAVHNGDQMAVSAYDNGIDAFIPPSFPGGGVDRMVEGDPGTFSSMHASRAGEIPPASIDVVSSTDGNTVTVVVTSNFVGGLNGDYRLAAVLLQDGINGLGQTNYYNDGMSGPMQNPNAGSMPNFNWVGAGATVSPVIHDHVAVALGDNQINGAAGSLPTIVNDGDVETHTYTFTQNASWVIGNMHAVGMLVNGSTGEILNAGKSAITGTESLSENFANNFSISAMPNPTNGVANIVVDLAVAAEMNMVIVDVLGNEVYNYGNTTLEAGVHTTKIDLTNNAEGIYFAKVNLNGAVKTVKINVVK